MAQNPMLDPALLYLTYTHFPGVSATGTELIPDGYHLGDDLDGVRLVKKELEQLMTVPEILQRLIAVRERRFKAITSNIASGAASERDADVAEIEWLEAELELARHLEKKGVTANANSLS